MMVSSVAPPTSCRMIGADRHARPRLEPNSVAGDGIQGPGRSLRIGAVDDFRIDAGADRFEHVAPRQVDRLGRLPVEIDVGPMGGDQRPDDVRHVSAGQVMGLERPRRDRIDPRQTGLHGHDLAADDDGRIHLADRHHHQLPDVDVGPGEDALNPEVEVAGQDCQEDDRADDDDQAGQRNPPAH